MTAPRDMPAIVRVPLDHDMPGVVVDDGSFPALPDDDDRFVELRLARIGDGNELRRLQRLRERTDR